MDDGGGEDGVEGGGGGCGSGGDVEWWCVAKKMVVRMMVTKMVADPWWGGEGAAMVPYEAFAYRCGAEDAILQELYKPKTRGKLYYACPQLKHRENYFGCEISLWKEERVCLLLGSPGASTTPNYSPGPSTPPRYSPGPSRNAECENCQLLIGKLQVLEATLEMYMHPEKHTIDSTAILHDLYNDMGKFSLEEYVI
ncbi:hypothetical protein Tco_0866265 [Tanacetum coccineum]